MATASKSLTMADLNSAIKPLIESMNRFRETQSGTDTMLSELSQMVTHIMTRLDAHDQTIHSAVTDAVKRAAPKKLAGKGKAVAKKPSKPQLRKGVKKQTEEDTPEDEAPEDEAPQEDAPEDEAPQDEAPEDETEDATEEKKTKKAVTKKAVTKKAVAKAVTKVPTKKTATKKAAKPKTKTNPNIMTIFKNAFRENESQFDKVITAKVKKEIEAANAEDWNELEGESLLNARANVYREYIKNNHKQVLEALKEAFAKKQAEEEAEEEAEDPADDA